MSVIPIYAALLTLLFLTLSWRVILYRRAEAISLGDNGDKNLRKRIRTQANFVEYTPLALVLMMLAEHQGAPHLALHALGLALLSGRLLHAFGFGSTPQRIVLRQAGMALTLMMLAFTAVGLLGHALW